MLKRAVVFAVLTIALCVSLSGCTGRGGKGMETAFGKAYFARARVGLFSHYTYATYAEDKGTNWGGTWYSREDPRPAASPEEAAAMFDGKTVYLHVLNLPADGVLTLPRPADGRKFASAACGDAQLTLEKAGKGYRIVLPEDADPVDTVVRLTAK